MWEALKHRTYSRNPETNFPHPWCCRMMPQASARELASSFLIFFINGVLFLVLRFSHCSCINWSLIQVPLSGEAWFHLWPSCKSSWKSKFLTHNVAKCLHDVRWSHTCEASTVVLLLHTVNNKTYNYIMSVLSIVYVVSSI